MKRIFHKRASERGATSLSVSIFSAALVIGMSALVSQVRDIRRAKKFESQQDTTRRVNEAALQIATQLVNSGLLYINPDCEKLLPQSKEIVGREYIVSGCSATADTELDCEDTTAPGWLYRTEDGGKDRAVVDVCVPVTEKSSAPVDSSAPAGSVYVKKKIAVPVTFLSYSKEEVTRKAKSFDYNNPNAELGDADEPDDIGNPAFQPGQPIPLETVTRWLAKVKVQRLQEDETKPPYAALHGEINLGAEVDANQGLLGKHAASDICFYMRPKTIKHGAEASDSDDGDDKKYLGLIDRTPGPDSISSGDGCDGEECPSYSRYKFVDLEPRPDGKLADQFGMDYDWDELVKNRDSYKESKEKESFEVLDEWLIGKKAGKKGVFPTYKNEGYRVGRDGYWGGEGKTISGVFNGHEAGTPPPAVPNMKVSTTKINIEGEPDPVPVLSDEDFRSGKKVYKRFFAGVTPKYKADEGPNFKWFLMGDESRPESWAKVLKKDNWKDELKEGCKKFGKNDKAAFCTKVNIPYRNHSFKLPRKCVLKTATIPPTHRNPSHGNPDSKPPKFRLARAKVNVSCSPGWVDKVKELYKENRKDFKDDPDDHAENIAHEKLKEEVNFAQVVSALEIDDDFLDGKGVWDHEGDNKKIKEEIWKKFKNAYTNYRDNAASALGATFVEDGNVFKWNGDVDDVKSTHTDPHPYPCNPYSCSYSCGTAEAPQSCETTCWHTCYQDVDDNYAVIRTAKEITINYYEYEDVKSKGAMQTLDHTSNKCAIFYYKQPAWPTRCRFNYRTAQKDNDDGKEYICRNQDGCFDEDTRIRMADGTDRQITQLKKGEFVFNPVTAKPARIVKLVIGPEFKPLIHVSVDGRMVKVTESHPFMTKRGWVQAKSILKGDLLLTSRNGYLPVTSIGLGESGRTVANLALEGDGSIAESHYVLADGVVTGDLVIQSMLDGRATK